MKPERTCPDCGATLPADAPRGLCPNCLMGAALPARRPRRRRAPTGDRRLRAGRPRRPRHHRPDRSGPSPACCCATRRPARSPGPIVRPDATDADASIRYRIDGEIARGGMGAVLKGRDPDLGRDVAIKVLRDDLRDNADLVRRFVEEAQIGGQLQHPGVVPIYELGTFADRRPFFSMKLVKGQTLAELLDGPLGTGRRPAPVPVDLRGHRADDGLRPRPRRDPPRPEAVQRDGRQLRRGPGDGLGPGARSCRGAGSSPMRGRARSRPRRR